MTPEQTAQLLQDVAGLNGKLELLTEATLQGNQNTIQGIGQLYKRQQALGAGITVLQRGQEKLHAGQAELAQTTQETQAVIEAFRNGIKPGTHRSRRRKEIKPPTLALDSAPAPAAAPAPAKCRPDARCAAGLAPV